MAKDFLSNHGVFVYRILCMISIFLICNGPALIYTLLCIYSDVQVPYPYVMITCNLIMYLTPNIAPEAWIYATTRFQRILWDVSMYIVLAILIINAVCGHWMRSYTKEKEISKIRPDNELLCHKNEQLRNKHELLRHQGELLRCINEQIRREIAEKEIIIARLKRERAEQMVSEKQKSCRRLIKKKKQRQNDGA